MSEQNSLYGVGCTVLPLSDGYINIWGESNTSDFGIYLYQQRFDGNGKAVSSKTLVQNGNLADQEYKVTRLANGDYVLTWRTYGAQNDTVAIYQRIFDINGNPKTNKSLVELIPDSILTSEVKVTAFSNGKYSISWQWDNLWDNEIHDEIYHRVFDASGSALKTDVFDGQIFFKPGILALTNGGYVVAWESREQLPNTIGNPIYLRVHDAAGQAVGEDLIVDPNPMWDPELTITALTGDKYVITWLSDRNSDGCKEIYQRMFTSNGNPIGSEILVKDTTFAIQGRPEITALQDGGYVVVWERYFGGGGGIFKRQYDANGFATESEILISNPDDSQARHPKVTTLANGTYIVTWESGYNAYRGYDAYKQLFDPSGKRIGNAIPISDVKSSNFSSVTPIALPDGSHVVTWEAGGNIYQRFFDNEALPTLTTDRDWAVGTDRDDLLSVAPHTLTAGDILEALEGFDTLQLERAGMLDLRVAAAISGFEILSGSIGDDVIATDISRIASFATVDLGSGVDVLQLAIEGICDLRTLPKLNGVEKLQVQGSDTDDILIAYPIFGFLQEIDLGSGTDSITLGVAGTFDLQGARNIEELKGTIGNDVLVVDWNALISGMSIDLGLGLDTLELAGGGTFRLSQFSLIGIEKFVVSNGYMTQVVGTRLRDIVMGGAGQDSIIGGAGKDQLSGEGGNDRIDGGPDGDRLTGGKGKDVFAFTSRPGLSNVDTITDFNVKDDAIWLDNAVFRNLGKGTLAKPAKLISSSFVIGNTAGDAGDRVIYDKATGALYYDPDGTGIAPATKFAQLKKGLALKSSDFFVI
ncbi:calcium-binding protein [Microvirga sp. 2MCAF35]|uniref:calcium-binding protein n=1 Tax=Microvirga sp. 2MCAF35 TaxID=3232987 RepID=UPI003F9D5529